MPSRPRFDMSGSMFGFGLGRLTKVLLIAWLAAWIAHVLSSGWAGWRFVPLAAEPTVLGLQLWRLVTHALVPPPSPLGMFFLLLVVAIFMPRFEARWGIGGMLRFLAVTTLVPALLHVAAGLLHPRGAAEIWGPEAFVAGLFVAFAVIWPDAQILLFFVLPIRARTAAILGAILTALFTISELPTGIGFGFIALAGMGASWLYLTQAWRLKHFAPLRSLSALVSGWRDRRRRSRMRVVDRDFDRWLDRHDDDVRH